MRVVLDTNVLVSALLTPQGTAARVLSIVLAGNHVILLDDRIVREYVNVLSRPRFNFSLATVTALVAVIGQLGENIIALPIIVNLPDQKDLPFWEVAITGQANYLVTGNTKHFPAALGRKYGVIVTSPSEFILKTGVETQ